MVAREGANMSSGFFLVQFHQGTDVQGVLKFLTEEPDVPVLSVICLSRGPTGVLSWKVEVYG